MSDLAAAGRTVWIEAEAHGGIPFDDIVLAIKPDNDMSRLALFDVLFDYEEDSVTGVTGMHAARWVNETGLGWGKYDLVVVWRAGPDRLTGTLVFNRDLFNDDTGALIAGLLARATAVVPVAQRRTVGELDLRSADDLGAAQRDLRDLRSCPAPATISELFDAAADRFGANVALRQEERSVTYAELARAIHVLAQRLAAAGGAPPRRR